MQGTQARSREDPFYNDLNSVFIPCRAILEMEAVIGTYLADANYDFIKDLPQSRPSSEQLLEILHASDDHAYERIVDYFLNTLVSKMKSVVLYERDHHSAARRGNVASYAKSRACLYFALHNLQVKFLLVKRFFDVFRGKTDPFPRVGRINSKQQGSLLQVFGAEYYSQYSAIVRDMLPQTQASKMPSQLLSVPGAITSEKIIQLLTNLPADEENNKIKFLMRGVKASLFICNLMFAHIDIDQPFSRNKYADLDPGELMYSQDFLPELIPAISARVAEKNEDALNQLYAAFDQLMTAVLEGISGAFAVASGEELKIPLTAPLYQIHPTNRTRMSVSKSKAKAVVPDEISNGEKE